jgi:hypothetical protein
MRHLKLRAAFLALAPLVFISAEAYDTLLSSQAVREAYFLGQRNDKKTAAFLSQYVQRPPLPKSGANVSELEILTPYAQAVQQSMRRTVGYSAQQAEEDYRKQGDTLRARVQIRFTPSYALQAAVSSSRNAAGNSEIQLRAEDFWRDFTFRLSQRQDGEERVLEPFDVWSEAIYLRSGEGGSSALDGAEVWLLLDAATVTSDPVTIDVGTPDGRHVTAEFDLAKLR